MTTTETPTLEEQIRMIESNASDHTANENRYTRAACTGFAHGGFRTLLATGALALTGLCAYGVIYGVKQYRAIDPERPNADHIQKARGECTTRLATPLYNQVAAYLQDRAKNPAPTMNVPTQADMTACVTGAVPFIASRDKDNHMGGVALASIFAFLFGVATVASVLSARKKFQDAADDRRWRDKAKKKAADARAQIAALQAQQSSDAPAPTA